MIKVARVALLATMAALESEAAFSVVQVQLLTRAGTSEPVHRDAYTLQESNAALTSKGRLESFEAGRALRLRYMDSDDNSQLLGIENFYSDNVQVSYQACCLYNARS
jgi:hypothetical protein